MSTTLISDLHLDPSRPHTQRAFLELLQSLTGHCDALYILGDFFEVWIGDDDDCAFNKQVVAALSTFTASGTPVFIMHGNRDFLLGDQFCQDSGCKLINDPSLVDVYGHKVLLMHGDSLCIDDLDYMTFRAESRSQAWRDRMLALPIEQRRQLGQQMRAESEQANSNKSSAIMDVNLSEVSRQMQQFDTALLIHGHTHRPMCHPLETDRGPAQRIVLGDWDRQGWLLEFGVSGEYELKSFDILT